MKNQTQIADEIETLIPAELAKKYSHLSFGEMADVPELEDYRDQLLRAERDWFEAAK